MSIDEIVNVSITVSTSQVTRAGFGTALIAGYTTAFPERVRSYTSLTALAADIPSGPIYTAAQRLFAQNPKVTTVKVGRRANAFTQECELIPKNFTAGFEYTVSVNGNDATYTVVALDTITEVLAGLESAINGLGLDLTTSDVSGTELTITADNAGEFFVFDGFEEADISFKDTTSLTPDDLSDDLDAIEAEDSDWYCLLLDSNSPDEIEEAADWIATKYKIFGASTSDFLVLGGGTTDNIAYTLSNASQPNTFLIYNGDHGSHPAAAWAGVMLPKDPGSATWAYKTLAGISVDAISSTQQGNLEGDNCNHYLSVGGVSITRYGVVADGEYIDVVRFVHWLHARLQERIYSLLTTSDKIPYTDPSVDMIKAQILAQLQEGIGKGGLAASPEPVVTAPAVADVSAGDKSGRLLPDVEFTATLAGAIHKFTITGVVSV